VKANANSAAVAVKEYYGKTLQGATDLRTGACCCTESIPASHRAILEAIDIEITERFYGCGSPVPPALEGCTVLDLGCGSGRDAYLVSRLVGEEGHVVGVDMTDEQLDVARRHRVSQARRFGQKQSNVDFRSGAIEDLRQAGVEDESIDVVISNCVINLSPHKERVFAEIFRVLKPGGELYFSDVFAGCRVPAALREDPLLWGECLAGAMYIEDFRRLMLETGCRDYRVVAQRPVEIGNEDVEQRMGRITFDSMTVRAFKLSTLEDRCEDYGQVACYLGTLQDYPSNFSLDDHHRFVAGKPMLVCGNTASMLSETRYARHFRVTGDRSVHYGPFGCLPMETSGLSKSGCC
jgi:arsenite methyltransferase